MTTPTNLPAWQALQQDYEQTQSVQMRDQFAQDPERANRYWLEVGGLAVDFSKNRINDQIIADLVALAEQAGLPERIEQMYRGEKSPKGKLREWIKELGINDRLAKVMLDRINEVLENRGEFDKALSSLYGGLKCENLILDKDGEQKTPIYDVLQFLSVTSGTEDKKAEGKNDDKLRA